MLTFLSNFFLLVQNWVESNMSPNCSSYGLDLKIKRKVRQKELDSLLWAEWGFQEVLLFEII